MKRLEEFQKAIGNDPLLKEVIKYAVQLEEELEYLRSLPQIKVHPKDKTRQKATPAAKLYKEKLQQYTNIIRLLMRATDTDEQETDSPLRRWLNEHIDK